MKIIIKAIEHYNFEQHLKILFLYLLLMSNNYKVLDLNDVIIELKRYLIKLHNKVPFITNITSFKSRTL